MAGNGRTRYQQVAGDLRAKLVAGTYTVGSPLPSITQMATEYAVSPTVVQQALRELKRDRLVEGVPGKGVFVIAVPEPDGVAADNDRVAALEAKVNDLLARMDEMERAMATLKNAG